MCRHLLHSTKQGRAYIAATDRVKDDQGRRTKKYRYTCRTTSTVLQVAVDHAFTDTYVDRLRPNDPPESRHQAVPTANPSAPRSTSPTNATASTGKEKQRPSTTAAA
jgi:hypothetical protein